MTHLRGARVLLTGAAGGIGRATTRALLASGAKVFAVDRDLAGLRSLAAEVDSSALLLHEADLLDRPALSGIAESCAGALEGIDVLIHNAGLTVHGLFRGMSRQEIDAVMDVDLRVPMHLTHAALPYMSSGGHIVFVSSMAGVHAFPTHSTYCAAKFGLRGFAEALRPELERDGIGVTAVLPGTTATDFLANATSHDAHTTGRLAKLMRKLGTPPARVADAILHGITHNTSVERVGIDSFAVSAAAWLAPALVPRLIARASRSKLLGGML